MAKAKDKAGKPKDDERANGEAQGPDTAADESIAADPDDTVTAPTAEAADTVAAEADAAAEVAPAEDTPSEDTAAGTEADTPAEPEDLGNSADHMPESAAAEDTLAAAPGPEEPADDTPTDSDTPPADADAAAAPADPPAPQPAPAPQVIRETVVERKAGFVPTALGGIVAAALGFGAAQYVDAPLPFLPKPPQNPFETETRAALDDLNAGLGDLTGRVDEAQKAIEILDLGPVSAALAGLEDAQAQMSGEIAALGDQVAAFDSRLTAIEKQPLADALSPEAIAAYERELDALRQSIAAQQQALQDMVSPETIVALDQRVGELQAAVDAAVTPDALAALAGEVEALAASIDTRASAIEIALDGAQTALSAQMADTRAALETSLETETGDLATALDTETGALETALGGRIDALEAQMADQQAAIDAAAAEADAIRAQAERQAAVARSLNAIADVGAAVQAGRPYAEPLAEIVENGLSVPDVLQANAIDGVPGPDTLTDAYPEYARAALAIARTTASDEADASGGGGVGGFLRNQLGARSVTPREGNDPDAILSRAEAAVKAGRLEVALEEISALPDEVRAALDEWVAMVDLRRDALAAARSLAQDNTQK